MPMNKERNKYVPEHMSMDATYAPKLQPEVLNMWGKDRQPAPIAEATKVKTPYTHREQK